MMIKSIVQLHDVGPALTDEPATGTWLRLVRTTSAVLRFLVSWPATVYRARQDMEQLSRMSERELRDIGLIRQDLYDLQALPLGRDPTATLGLRVHQRRLGRQGRVDRFDLSNVAPWGL